MISNRPYLIRAIYDWIVDNEWTPHFQVDANYPSVKVPQQFVQEGVIVLNAHPQAVSALHMDNDGFSFKARFQGIEESLFFPAEAVLAVFARENGQGMPFPPEPYPDEADEPEEVTTGLSAIDGNKVDSNKPNKTDGDTAKTTSSKSKASKTKSKSSKKPTLSVVK